MLHALFVAGVPFRLAGDVGKGMFYVGYGGLYLPRFTILATEPTPERFVSAFYYVVLAAFAAALAVLGRISRSPFGLALRAIRDNDVRATAVGIPLARFRWRAFVISGVAVGLAGALYGQLDRQVTPEQLHWLFSAKLVVATVLGGPRRFVGPVVGALALVTLESAARRLGIYDGLVLGILLIAVILCRPGGLAGGPPAVTRPAGMPA